MLPGEQDLPQNAGHPDQKVRGMRQFLRGLHIKVLRVPQQHDPHVVDLQHQLYVGHPDQEVRGMRQLLRGLHSKVPRVPQRYDLRVVDRHRYTAELSLVVASDGRRTLLFISGG